MVVLSKSSLNTYITCPRLYKFIYIDKIAPDIKSPAAQRGIDFHDFACNYYEHLEIVGDQLCIDPVWMDEQMIVATAEVRPYLHNFLEFEQRRWKLCLEKKPNTPAKFYMPVLKEKKIVNLGLEIIGIIDRLDLNFDEKSYTICDYKTEVYSRKPWKMTEHRREMSFYKKLVETSGLVQFPVIDFCIYYPHSNDVWVESFKKITLNALERKLEDVRTEISAGRYPCNVSIFCRYCDFGMTCDMS